LSPELDRVISSYKFKIAQPSDTNIILSNPFSLDKFIQYETGVIYKDFYYFLDPVSMKKTNKPIIYLVKLTDNPLTLVKAKYLNTKTKLAYEFNLQELVNMFIVQ
jgi:hypothetical protein